MIKNKLVDNIWTLPTFFVYVRDDLLEMYLRNEKNSRWYIGSCTIVNIKLTYKDINTNVDSLVHLEVKNICSNEHFIIFLT